MSSTTALRTVRTRNIIAGAGALATAAALGATLFAAAPAAAAAPPVPYGTVTAGNGVIQRQYPSTDSSEKGSLRYRQQVGLRCKVRAQNIEGNTIWYLLRDSSTWVSAKYVDNTGNVAYCKDVQRSNPAVLNSVPNGAKG